VCAQFISGPPIIPGALGRSDLVDRLSRSHSSANLIVAPSGYGKTVLAAQYAQSVDRVCWVNCLGEQPDMRLVMMGTLALFDVDAGSALDADDASSHFVEFAAAISRAPRDELKRCVVVDDAALCADSSVLEDLWLVAQVLSQVECVLVVTSRAVRDDASTVLHRYGWTDQDDLRLTREEAHDLAQGAMRWTVNPADVDAVWEQTQGHAAFFAIMVQVSREDTSLGGSSNRLSAWVAHLLVSQVSSTDLSVLKMAALLKTGRASDIDEVPGMEATAALKRLTDTIPLVRLDSHAGGYMSGRTGFAVHDLLAEHLILEMAHGRETDAVLARRAVHILINRGDLPRAAEIVRLAGTAAITEFLEQNGFECLRRGGAAALGDLIETIPLSSMMAGPDLLLLWSDVLLDRDEFAESLSKARAARVLAEHQGDSATAAQAVANCLDALRLSNRWDEAAGLLDEVRDLAASTTQPAARVALFRAAAPLLALAGQYEDADAMLLAVCRIGDSERSRDASGVREAQAIRALIPCFWRGDFWETARELSPLAAIDVGRLPQRVDASGNMATALIELGRIDRAQGLLHRIIGIAGNSSLIQFLPSLGAALFCDGEEERGLGVVHEGVSRALAQGAEAEAAQNRVYEAMLLRAHGMLDESLTSAERAYERLSAQDFLDFRRLSALEIAASLLALGDPAAARAWVEPVIAAGFGSNAHHQFRATMVLSECDRVDGNYALGVSRVAAQAEHVRSENSNFQAAMYCRAFPALLGVISAAVGATEVPVHMLRMIPAEAGERALRASQETLPKEEWEILGRRLLGSQQFSAFVDRKGRPICRVKLFGGLEVTVGDRSIREKDWRKRKARMLFAIMVLERGRQLSREQLLEHVWPDLSEDRAKNNFYVAWSTMKSALAGVSSGPSLYVDNTGGLCSIVREAVRSDVDEFEEYLTTARDAEAAGDVRRAIESYQRLSAIYRGELLPGDLYDEWFTPIRDRYRLDFIASMLRVVELLLERDDPCEAVVYARRALAVDPFREDLYQAVLRCQIAAGQRSAAIETFVACKTQIAEELGLDPAPETVALYQQILCMEERPRYDDFGLNSAH